MLVAHRRPDLPAQQVNHTSLANTGQLPKEVSNPQAVRLSSLTAVASHRQRPLLLLLPLLPLLTLFVSVTAARAESRMRVTPAWP